MMSSASRSALAYSCPVQNIAVYPWHCGDIDAADVEQWCQYKKCQPYKSGSIVAQWLRFEWNGQLEFGILRNDIIQIHQGHLFGNPIPTDKHIQLAEVRVRTPCDASKMVCLWNNFYELAAKLAQEPPDEPLYLLKAPSAFLAHGEIIRRPKSYFGKVVYEGELGVVIGRRLLRCERSRSAGSHFWLYLR